MWCLTFSGKSGVQIPIPTDFIDNGGGRGEVVNFLIMHPIKDVGNLTFQQWIQFLVTWCDWLNNAQFLYIINSLLMGGYSI